MCIHQVNKSQPWRLITDHRILTISHIGIQKCRCDPSTLILTVYDDQSKKKIADYSLSEFAKIHIENQASTEKEWYSVRRSNFIRIPVLVGKIGFRLDDQFSLNGTFIENWEVHFDMFIS